MTEVSTTDAVSMVWSAIGSTAWANIERAHTSPEPLSELCVAIWHAQRARRAMPPRTLRAHERHISSIKKCHGTVYVVVQPKICTGQGDDCLDFCEYIPTIKSSGEVSITVDGDWLCSFK